MVRKLYTNQAFGLIVPIWTVSKLGFFLIAAAVFAADQLAKSAIKNLDAPIEIIPQVLRLGYLENTGAAFGFFPNTSLLLAILGSVVVVGIIVLYRKLPEKPYAKVSAALLLGGTLGNLYDRVFLGHVIDFIQPSFWPAFNIADTALTIGTCGLLYYFYRTR